MAEKKKNKKTSKNIFKNYWAIATIVLAIILVLILVSESGSGISADAAGEKALAFLNQQTGGGVELVGVIGQPNLYEVTVSYQGQDVPVYITRDGKSLVQGVTPLEATPATTQPTDSIPKSDKPVLEAIVTPYCPYGLQYMKGLLPVYDLLKDKADISILSLGVTHMQNEELETQRQICISEEYNKDMMFSYIKKLVYDTNSEKCYAEYHTGPKAQDVAYFDTCMAPTLSSIMMELNIDENKIDTCMTEKGKALYDAAVSYARSTGAGGSPSPFLNGVTLRAGRSPEAIKTALCDAFNEAPAECSTTLSSETPSAGITSATSGSDTNAQC